MAKYQARQLEMHETLGPRGVPRPDDIIVKLKLAIDLWADKKDKLLIDLADRVLWAHARTDPLADNWKKLIKAARADLLYLFGFGTLKSVVELNLLPEWQKMIQEEDRCLELLHDLAVPELLEQMIKYHVDLGTLISELDQKWTSILRSKSDFRTPEQRAIAEADRVVMEVLDKQETLQREVLRAAADLHIVITTYANEIRAKLKQAIGALGAAVAENVMVKELIKILTNSTLSGPAKQNAKIVATAVNHLIVSSGAAARQYLQCVDTYRYTLRNEGAILQIFKTNRDQVAAYESANNLGKSNDLRAKATAAITAWAQSQPPNGLKNDATAFATEITAAIQATYDRCRVMDENFRNKFNGLFTGPLSGANLELLTERYQYEQQLAGLKSKGADRKMLEAPKQLKEGFATELDKSLVPLNAAAAEFPYEAGELLLLHGKEFKELLAQEMEKQITELIKTNIEITNRLSVQGISQDFDRSEFEHTLK